MRSTTYLKAGMGGVGIFLFIYLLGAFTANSFNIATWNPAGRFIVAAGGGMAALLVIAFILDEH